jgi:4-amino-4-deoxy-L-arabinose transferase-like glycosyltransferase
LLLALGLAIYLPLVGARDIVTSHEARVAQSAREMAASGWPWAAEPMRVPPVHLVRRAADGALRLEPAPGEPPADLNPWLVPTLNGVIRLQKPPLPYWCAAMLFKLSDGFSETASRLFPALFAAVGTMLVYQLARELIGEIGAWLAGLIWLSSYFIFDPYRKAMPDPYLAFFTLMAVWAWVTASARRSRSGERTTARMLAFYVALGFGGLAKGPVIFLHVALALIVYHVCFRRRKLPGNWWSHVLGVLIFLAMTVPWPLYVLSHVPHALDLWKYESVGELGENVENAQRWYYYLPQLFLISLPWTAMWIIGVWTALRRGARERKRRLLFAAIWFIATVIFFSFVNLKKNAYLLPVMPAGVLLAALGLRVVLAAIRSRRREPAKTLLGVHAVIAAAGAVVIAWMSINSHDTPAHRAASVALTAAAFVLGCYAIREVSRHRGIRAVEAMALCFALVLFVNSNYVITAKDNFRSAHPAAEVLASRLKEPDTAIYHRYLPPEAAVYLPVGNSEVPQTSRVLTIVGDRRLDAGPLTSDDLQPWFADRKVVSVETIPVKGKRVSGRWSVVEIRTEPR